MHHTPTSILRAAVDLAKRAGPRHPFDLSALALKSLPDAALDAREGAPTMGYGSAFAVAWCAYTLSRATAVEGDWPSVEELLAALGREGASLAERRILAADIERRAAELWAEASASYAAEVERLRVVAGKRAELAKPVDPALSAKLHAVLASWLPEVLALVGNGAPLLTSGRPAVDRLKIAQRLSEQRPAGLPPLQICIQVNIDGGASKSGVAPGDALALAQEVSKLPRLQLRGLMAIPEPAPDFIAACAVHQKARELFDQINGAGTLPVAMDTLSLGMTADLEAAIQAGSTMVRVGTAIFGGRS